MRIIYLTLTTTDFNSLSSISYSKLCISREGFPPHAFGMGYIQMSPCTLAYYKSKSGQELSDSGSVAHTVKYALITKIILTVAKRTEE